MDKRNATWTNASLAGTSNVVSNVATNASNNYIQNYDKKPNLDDVKLKRSNICSDCLNPATTRQQFFGIGGLTYPGGDNPQTINKDPDYTYIPSNLAEYPAIGHDRRYDKLKTAGALGLFTDTRAIGADWRFVGEEFAIAANPFINPIDRATAAILGNGLALAAMPKTLYHLFKNKGLSKALVWYNYSNQGVTNIPAIHKHK